MAVRWRYKNGYERGWSAWWLEVGYFSGEEMRQEGRSCCSFGRGAEEGLSLTERRGREGIRGESFLTKTAAGRSYFAVLVLAVAGSLQLSCGKL